MVLGVVINLILICIAKIVNNLLNIKVKLRGVNALIVIGLSSFYFCVLYGVFHFPLAN